MLFVQILIFVTLLVASVSTVAAFGYVVIRFVELHILTNIPFIDDAISAIANKFNKNNLSAPVTASASNNNQKNDKEFDEIMAKLSELGI